MGLNYAFEIIAPSASWDRLVLALAEHLEPEVAVRVHAATPAGPRGFMDLARGEIDESNACLCLSFLFELDEAVADYHAMHGWPAPATGRSAIGCVWSTLRCGDCFALFRGTAAATSISLLFERSPGVREVFAAIGRDADALLVTFDDESGDLLAVWPKVGRLGVYILQEPDDWTGEEWVSKIDEYCEAVLGAARDGPLGLSVDRP